MKTSQTSYLLIEDIWIMCSITIIFWGQEEQKDSCLIQDRKAQHVENTNIEITITMEDDGKDNLGHPCIRQLSI